MEGCSETFSGHGRHLCSSEFVVEDGPEHSGRYPSGQPVAGPHTARGVGIAEVAAAAGDVPVAHVEVLVGWLTRGVTSLADDADEPHNPDHVRLAHVALSTRLHRLALGVAELGGAAVALQRQTCRRPRGVRREIRE